MSDFALNNAIHGLTLTEPCRAEQLYIPAAVTLFPPP